MEGKIPAAVHPDDRESVLNLAQRHYDHSNNTEFSSDHRIILPDGAIRWMNVRGVTERDSENNPVKTYGIAMDITERKDAEDALRKSEMKYRTLFDSIDEGFSICELIVDEEGKPCDFRWLEVNPSWEKQTGLKNPVGKSALELVPNLEQSWIDTYGKVVLTGEPVRFQQSSDAMARWFDVYSFRIGEQKFRKFGALFNDITRRKTAEDLLRQNEIILRENKERLQAALEGSKGIWDLDLINGTTIRSLHHDQIWGYAHEIKEWNLENAIKQVVPEDRQIIEKAYDKAFKTGLLFHENRIIWPDGSIHWIAASGSVRFNKKGKPERVTGVLEDITKRKEAEIKLQESEEKFRTLANNISQLVWMADNNGRIFWYNKRWLDYTGNSPQQIEGLGWKKIIHPDHLKRLLKTVKHAIETGEAWEELIQLRNTDNEYKWFLFGAIPVWDEMAHRLHWFGTATDITKQRKIEDLLKKEKDLVENLLYIAAHDLKGPVANMYGFFNIMDELPPENKLSLFENFRKLIDQMDKTISGITDILRVRDTDNSSATEVYFESLMNDVIPEFRDKLTPAAIHFDFSGKPNIQYIEPFLYSIVKNLISNSIKYCRDDVPLHIEIFTQKEGSHTLLSFSDNGIGIDIGKYGNKLFSPFQRLEVSKATGTGIGLYLIKSIIEKNGGYIKVESQPGEGTIFLCYLKEYTTGSG